MASPEQQQQPNEYFSLCQTEAQFAQYIAQADATILKIVQCAKDHPIHAVLKAQPTLAASVKDKVLYTTVFTQTPFFPVGGGQNYDLGHVTINDVTYPIIGVFRIENIINHVIAFPKTQKGIEEYIGVTASLNVDMPRRLYNMYCHTTQHLLSAIASQVFNLPTFGWTCGTYNPKLLDPLHFNKDNAVPSYDELNGVFSVIDFSGNINIDLFKLINFMINAIDITKITLPIFVYKLSLILQSFTTLKVNDIAKFLSLTDLSQLKITTISEYSTYLAANPQLNVVLENIDLTQNDAGVTFQMLIDIVELIANFVINYATADVKVQIAGVIEATGEDAPEQSTTSMGVTTSSTIVLNEDNTEQKDQQQQQQQQQVLRENKAKYSKYGKNGAVPKRYINIGLEVSPCCGTHVDSLNVLQSVQVIGTQKYGSNRWRLVFVTHHTAQLLKTWYTTLNDTLKLKLSCQSHEIITFVTKALNAQQSIKYYNKKIYDLVVKDIISIYSTNKDFFQNEENQKNAILHYNDTFFTTNADLEQICWGFAEQFRLKYPDIAIRPTLFLTTHEVDVNNVAAADDGVAQNTNVTALFYVYGPTDKEKAFVDATKTFGSSFATSVAAKGGGRPGSFQGKMLNATDASNIDRFNKTIADFKTKYPFITNMP